MTLPTDITPEQLEIANAIDLMQFHIKGKRALDLVPNSLDLEVVNVVGQDAGHSIIHLLANKCSYTDNIDFTIKEKLGSALVQMFMLGVYMAEHGKAKLGPVKPLDPLEIQ